MEKEKSKLARPTVSARLSNSCRTKSNAVTNSTIRESKLTSRRPAMLWRIISRTDCTRFYNKWKTWKNLFTLSRSTLRRQLKVCHDKTSGSLRSIENACLSCKMKSKRKSKSWILPSWRSWPPTRASYSKRLLHAWILTISRKNLSMASPIKSKLARSGAGTLVKMLSSRWMIFRLRLSKQNMKSKKLARWQLTLISCLRKPSISVTASILKHSRISAGLPLNSIILT